MLGPSTTFPVSMARGASFDPALEERIGEAIGAELRASEATFTGAVCMNLLRHPAWGRAQETYGEDPRHLGEMAAALTRGLQARRVGDEVVVAVANTGDRAGSTVVQLYASVPGSAHERPPKRLVGFAKIRLAPGASAEAQIPVDRSLLDVRVDGAWVRENLPVELSAGLDTASARPI